MEKEYKVKKEQTIHQFYCDKCGTLIGESAEYDDGYYYEFGNFELDFFIKPKWYRLKKCLCYECKTEEIDKVRKLLINFGFNESLI